MPGVVQRLLITREREPLRTALIRARSDQAHGVGQRHGGLPAENLLQRPREPVGFDERLFLEATFGSGLDDDGELIAL